VGPHGLGEASAKADNDTFPTGHGFPCAFRLIGVGYGRVFILVFGNPGTTRVPLPVYLLAFGWAGAGDRSRMGLAEGHYGPY